MFAIDRNVFPITDLDSDLKIFFHQYTKIINGHNTNTTPALVALWNAMTVLRNNKQIVRRKLNLISFDKNTWEQMAAGKLK